MFKRLPRARIAYLAVIVILFAAVLSVGSFRLLQQDEATPMEGVADQAVEPQAETQPQTESLDELNEVALAQVEQAKADAAGLEFDHHGNPIRQDPAYEKIVEDGTTVEFTVENFLGVGGRGGELAPEIFEGELAVLKFRIGQADTGEVMPDLRPAVWLDLTDETEHADESNHSPEACKEKVAGFLGGTLAARADVNLNSYFVLAMNEHASISVIDPMIDVAGMTNLYSAIQLPKSGEDWAISANQQHLFVTIPETGQVTVADLEQFWAIKRIDVGANPVRIAFQPDQVYLWVGNNAAEAGRSGVTVIDPVALEVVAFIPTGAGHHEIAFSADSRYAFVTNDEAGTLSVIDAQELNKVKDLQVGSKPVAVDLSGTDQTIYVADEEKGMITTIDGDTLEIVDTMVTKPGLAALRLTPEGRWGFAANPASDQVYIFDAAANRLLYELPVKGQPDQITFSPTAAYIRTRSLPAVVLIPLADLAEEGTISVLTVPIGQVAPGAHMAVADAVSVTPEEGAMVIANPADDQVYYYVEGSQAAMGSFQGHGLRPRAVKVLDRSLHEVAPGVYQGGVRFPQSGEYDVAFLLDSPQIVHCFQVTVKPNPEVVENQGTVVPDFEFLSDLESFKVGETFTLRFALTDPETQASIANLEDLYVLASQTAGNWKQRYVAQAQGEGVYAIDISVPRPGLYNVFFTVPSLQANYDQLPNLYLRAKVGETSQ